MMRARGWTRLVLVFLFVSPSMTQQSNAQARPEVQGAPLTPEWCRQLPRPGYRDLDRVSVPGSWFEVYRVHPGVFAIYEPHHYEEVICYLIEGSRRALLFDTGLGIGDLREVVTRLSPLPVTVLNSHTHFDHVGGNWQFRDLLGLDTPFTRRNARGASHRQVSDAVAPERFCGPLPPGFEPRAYSIRPFHISRFVGDGDVLDLGDRTLEVVLTPGHTPDCLCLLDRQNRLLFMGDTFYPGPIYLYVPETDVEAYARSVDRLAALIPQLDLLLTAHNFPVSRPQMLARLAEAFRRVRSRTAEFSLTGGLREYKFEGFSLLLADK